MNLEDALADVVVLVGENDNYDIRLDYEKIRGYEQPDYEVIHAGFDMPLFQGHLPTEAAAQDIDSRTTVQGVNPLYGEEFEESERKKINAEIEDLLTGLGLQPQEDLHDRVEYILENPDISAQTANPRMIKGNGNYSEGGL